MLISECVLKSECVCWYISVCVCVCMYVLTFTLNQANSLKEHFGQCCQDRKDTRTGNGHMWPIVPNCPLFSTSCSCRSFKEFAWVWVFEGVVCVWVDVWKELICIGNRWRKVVRRFGSGCCSSRCPKKCWKPSMRMTSKRDSLTRIFHLKEASLLPLHYKYVYLK